MPTPQNTQTICRQQPSNCLSVFYHFVGLTLKGLTGVGQNINLNVLGQCSICIPPENIRKECFGYFQGVYKWDLRELVILHVN